MSPFPYILFLVCAEECPRGHQLTELTGQMWVSCHHCFTVRGRVSCFCCMVLLLSKPALLSDH